MNNNTKNIIKYFLFLVLLICLFLVYEFLPTKEVTKNPDYQVKFYRGTGFEPGFYFDLSINSNGVDFVMNTQEGQKYIGLLDVIKDKDMEKDFTGTVKNIENQDVKTEVKIIKKECHEPSDKADPYTVSLKIGAETWNGCVFEK